MPALRDLLRTLPVFSGVMRDFDPAMVPGSPHELFALWLREAIEDSVVEPHAMTLATSDGVPDARVLILKDLDEEGWWFATNTHSAKGIQLTNRAAAALTFYWPEVGRQVRVRGSIIAASKERSAADFRARGTAARAVALASRQSQELTDRRVCAAAVADAERRLAADRDLIAGTWQANALAAATVEFWQADKDRQHVRVQYRSDNNEWSHILLWP